MQIAIGPIKGPGISHGDKSTAWEYDASARGWGWIDSNKWVEVQYFQSVLPEKLLEVMDEDESKRLARQLIEKQDPLAVDIERRLKLAGMSQIWQVDLRVPGTKDDFVRHVCLLGTPWFREWTWFERYIVHPLTRTYAWAYRVWHLPDREDRWRKD
jgi:hypothetical protein